MNQVNKSSSFIDINTIGDRSITSKVVLQYDENEEPSVWLEIVGKDSEQYRAATKTIRQKNIKRFSVRGAGKLDGKTDEGASKIDSIQQENDFEIALSVTVGWGGFVSGVDPVAFSKEKFEPILTVRPSWREKIISKLEDEADFLKK